MKHKTVNCVAAVFLCILLTIAHHNYTKLVHADSSSPSVATAIAPDIGQVEGYQLYKESSLLQLFADAQGNLIVKDKRNDHLWRSVPAQEELAKETTKGLWLNNLKSSVHLEYIDVLEGETKIKYGNAVDLKANVSLKESEQGLEITYAFQAIGSSVTMIVSLNGDYLEVFLPADRLIEKDNIRFVNILLLPFLGAAQNTVKEGYLFVPDGIGAVIPFQHDGLPPSRYTASVYGNDAAISLQTARARRSEALYPVFGISKVTNAMLGIIMDGDATTNIQATPSGLYTTFNWVSAQFSYRYEYFKRTSSFGQGFKAYEAKSNKQDRRIRYYFLQGEQQSNYVGMASAYRKYLMEQKDMRRLQTTGVNIPLELQLFGGDREPSFSGSRLVATTTFDQARQIVDTLDKAGIRNMDVTFKGWMNKGLTGSLPKRFPAEKKLGGDDGLTRLIDDLKLHGIRMYLEDDYANAFSGNVFNARNYSVRDTNGRSIEEKLPTRGFSILKTQKKYLIQPELSLNYLSESLPRFKKWGVTGLNHDVVGEYIYSDHNPSNPSTRQETMLSFQKLLSQTKSELGGARVSHGNAYVLGFADHISSLPLDSNYNLMSSHNVPFYPIALHGLLSYSSTPGNLRNENVTGFLRSIEYGALPSYLLTFEDSAVLKDSYTKSIFSSQYRDWLQPIVSEYKKTNYALGDVQDRFIIDHRKIDEGVFATTYDNGKKIVVNYNDSPYSNGNVRVNPKDYAIVQKAE